MKAETVLKKAIELHHIKINPLKNQGIVVPKICGKGKKKFLGVQVIDLLTISKSDLLSLTRYAMFVGQTEGFKDGRALVLKQLKLNYLKFLESLSTLQKSICKISKRSISLTLSLGG